MEARELKVKKGMNQMNEKKKQESTKKIPVITKIEAQKRSERYNIYLDGEYAFPINEAILVKYVLHKGMEVTESFQKELETEDGLWKAYNRALNYLNYGLRSEKEVRDDLLKHEFTIETVISVVEKLKEQKYIDDLVYGESYTRTGANIGGKGPIVIKQELKRRGLDEATILKALEQYPFEQMVENGVAIGAKVIRRATEHSSRETRHKVQQTLMQKGFSSEVISIVLENIDTVKDDEDEYEALKKQGEKLWRKNERIKGFKKIQKVKTSLFQKGFPGDLINQFIEEKELEEDE